MDWFHTKAGIKQGDSLSPTMFAIFINDIVEDVKSVNIGIEIDGHNICILLYANDIVLLSDTKERLQKRLDKVYQWSLKWRIKCNANKSNILHVRQFLITRTNFNFKLGNIVLPMVTQYKYLGIVITEFIDYNVVAQILADAANTALSSLINKYEQLMVLDIILNHSIMQLVLFLIMPVKGVGYKNFTQIDEVSKQGN